MNWQRANIEAAVAYVRDRIEAGADDTRTKAVHEGLLDVLDPTRVTARMGHDAEDSAEAARVQKRRAQIERRGHHDRRLVNLGPPSGIERRSGTDRRSGKDRRGEPT